MLDFLRPPAMLCYELENKLNKLGEDVASEEEEVNCVKGGRTGVIQVCVSDGFG